MEKVNELTLQDVSQDVKPPGQGNEKPKNRKSRKAREAAGERYRYKQNVEFEAKRHAELEARLTFNGTLPLPIPQPMDPPTISIPITTTLAPELCAAVTDMATKVMKVVSHDEDVETLRTVTALQIYAKTFYARKNEHMDYDVVHEQDAKFIAEQFDVAIEPLASYIDMIGSTVVENQTFIPQVDPAVIGCPLPDPTNNGYIAMSDEMNILHNEIVVPTQYFESGRQAHVVFVDPPVGLNGRRLLDDIVIDGSIPPDHFGPGPSPELVHAIGRYRVVFRGTTLSELNQKYANFIHRYERRLKAKIKRLHIKEGKGGPAFIVGCGPPLDSRLTVEAWCLRNVPDAVLTIGAMMHFGRSEFQSETRDLSKVRVLVSRSGSVEKLMSLMTN